MGRSEATMIFPEARVNANSEFGKVIRLTSNSAPAAIAAVVHRSVA
jgi:hypothetical protein